MGATEPASGNSQSTHDTRPLTPEPHQGLLLLVLVAVFGLTFLNFRGTADANNWMRWVEQTGESGLVDGYRSANSNYPPGAFAMLTVAAKGATRVGITERTGIKYAIYFMLLITMGVFYAYSRDALLSALLGLSLILNSVALAYIDIFFAPFLILALWALHKDRPALFTLFYALAVLIKWQPLVLAPFFAIYILNIRHPRELRSVSWKRIGVEVALPAIVVGGATLLVFGGPVVKSLGEALSFPILSAQALNANWILTYILNVLDPARYAPLIDGAPNFIFESQGFISSLPRFVFWLVILAVLYLWFRAPKTFENLLLFTLLGYLTYFAIGVGAHENHLFIAVILAAMLAHINRRYLPLFAIWALAANINLFVFYGIDGRALPFSRMLWGFDTSILLAVVNIALYVSFLILVVRTVIVPTARLAPTLDTRSHGKIVE